MTLSWETVAALQVTLNGNLVQGNSAIAIQEALDGEVVEWMEKVSDEQYQGALQNKN